MRVRDLEPGDRLDWSDMRTQLWPSTSDGHLGEIDEFYAGESMDIKQVFVVEDGQRKPCGFIEINIRDFAEGSRSHRVPYVEGWFVCHACRGKGYGKALMIAAEQWARAQGCTELASDTELHNTTSIAVHKKLGFVETERVVCFLKRLD